MVCNYTDETLCSRLRIPSTQHRHFLKIVTLSWEKVPPGGICILVAAPAGQPLGGVLTFAACLFVFFFYSLSSLQLRQPAARVLTRTPASARDWTSLVTTTASFSWHSRWRCGSCLFNAITHLFTCCRRAMRPSASSSSRRFGQLALQGAISKFCFDCRARVFLIVFKLF